MGLEQFLESVTAVVGDEALGFLDLLEAPASRPAATTSQAGGSAP